MTVCPLGLFGYNGCGYAAVDEGYGLIHAECMRAHTRHDNRLDVIRRAQNIKEMKEKKRANIGDESAAGSPVQVSGEELVVKVKEFAEPLCASEGLELVFVECNRESSGRIIRIYIDKPEGVTLNDCTRISRQLIDILDVNLNTSWAYNLEVSSPGYDRPLGKPEDFDRFKGNTAKIRISSPRDGQKNFKGVILGFFDGFVKLSVNDKVVAIPYNTITKARLFEYNGENRCLYQK